MEEEIILYGCINPVMILNSFTMMMYSLSVKFRSVRKQLKCKYKEARIRTLNLSARSELSRVTMVTSRLS
jgi:hypothetical protein